MIMVDVQPSLARLDVCDDWYGVDDVEDGMAGKCTSAYIS